MWQLVCCFVIILVAIVRIYKILHRKRTENEPPLVPGHAIFGNGAQFRENAVEFLLDSAKKYGQIFSIRLLHHHVTIVMDPHAYPSFSEEPNFEFDPIQKQVNKNIFQFAAIDARHLIRDAAKTVRGNSLSLIMNTFSKHVSAAVNAQAKNPTVDGEWHQNGLKVTLIDTMFEAMVLTMFGPQPEGSKFTAKNLGRQLEKFHKYFNLLWVGLPIQMFPEANRLYNEMLDWQPSPQELLNNPETSPYVREATEIMLKNGQTEHDIKCHHTVFMHVNHNTLRATFWAVYHLMKNPDARAALQEEIDCFLQAKTIEGKVEISTRELAALPILDSVVKETFRHASGVFVMRAVTEDTMFKMSKDSDKQYLIRKGDKVAYYPPAIHHDPEIFEDPYKFIYNRFVDRTFYKNGKPIRSPLQPFGSLCPGVQLAQLQTRWFVLSWCAHFQAELLPNESTEYNLKNYGNEVVPEVHDVQIRYKLKQAPELSIV